MYVFRLANKKFFAAVSLFLQAMYGFSFVHTLQHSKGAIANKEMPFLIAVLIISNIDHGIPTRIK